MTLRNYLYCSDTSGIQHHFLPFLQLPVSGLCLAPSCDRGRKSFLPQLVSYLPVDDRVCVRFLREDVRDLCDGPGDLIARSPDFMHIILQPKGMHQEIPIGNRPCQQINSNQVSLKTAVQEISTFVLVVRAR